MCTTLICCLPMYMETYNQLNATAYSNHYSPAYTSVTILCTAQNVQDFIPLDHGGTPEKMFL